MAQLNEDNPAPEIEDLMESVRPRLRAFLLSLTGSDAAADDLTQETCLTIWEKRGEFDPSGDFRAWAFRIGFFQAQNYRRKLARRQKRELPGDELFDRIAEVAAERHGHSEQEEHRRSALLTCLGKLRDGHRELVLNRYQDGRSLKQLSEEEGINCNAMAQKLFRLKRTLLKCVEKQLGMLQHGSNS